MNDIDEFRKKEQPKGRKSRLDEHAKDILQLRAERYTLDQIRSFLAESKGVTISRKNLCQWVRKRENEPVQPQPKESSTSVTSRGAERSRPVVTSTATSGEDQAKQLDAAWQAIHQDESPLPEGSLLDQVKRVQEGQSK